MARILVLAALFLCAVCCFAGAAVIGIDMGSENIVLSTPGISDLEAKDFNTVEIVLNLQSHRKTANWIGFRNGERFFADDAMNLAARFPDLMTAAPHRFVGLLHNDTSLQAYMKSQHFPYNIKPHPERGTVLFEYPNAGEGGKTLTYSAEELLSMVFGHLKRTVEASTRHNEPVTAAVVTVPQFFTERQRQAVLDAGALAGLRIVSIQHPPTAAAVQYGIQNDGFDGKPTTVAIVDMGSGATQVGIYRYGGTASVGIRKPRFNIGFGNLTALALVSSSDISGRKLDACVARLIEDDFVAKTGLPRVLSGSTPQQRKSIISLMRAAKKVKETLTANRFALYTVEGMAPEKDFSSRFTREDFERHCVTDAAIEIGKLVDRAMEKAGQKLAAVEALATGAARTAEELAAIAKRASALTPSQIDRLEVIGGGPRVLKIIAELQSHTGRNVGRTMNSDEAASIGAGYRVAALSGTMRVKGFALQDATALGQSVSFSLAEGADHQPQPQQPLFLSNNAEPFLPAKKIIYLDESQEFVAADGVKLSVVYTMASAQHDGDVKTDRVIELTGLKSALNTVSYFTPFQRENNASYKVKVELMVSEAGILSVDAAYVDVRYAVNVTKTVQVPKTKGPEGSGEAPSDSEEGRKEEPTAENEKEKEKKESGTKAEEFETKTVTTAQRRRRTFPLTVVTTFTRSPIPIPFSEARASRATLKKLDKRDEAAFRLAATHNDLQSYLIWARGDGFDRYRARLNENEKAELGELLQATNLWVEDVADDSTPRSEVRERLVVLRDGVRKFVAIAEERELVAADSSGAEEDSLFGAAPEPTAASDDFIEDDGVRVKKARESTTTKAEDAPDAEVDDSGENSGDAADAASERLEEEL